MSDVVIRAEGLSKQYIIGGMQERYRTLRESLMHTIKAPLRRRNHAPRSDDSFWALDDVSFEIKQGEVVGLIGRNGAGKSTLLKILSRITEPTRGYAELSGRVGSLLEVGTGFHPELTGRENIYLNGSILGMRREEINRKFSEIVEFAEVQKFIDTPVKHYSSGMYLRLAFAVAAYLEPEILLVDEVLAVGDAAFQKKCLGKMGDVAKEGRTVLFVSHNMGAVRSLCSTGVMLHKGSIFYQGPIDKVIEKYISDIGLLDNTKNTTNQVLSQIKLKSKENNSINQEEIFKFEVNLKIPNNIYGFYIYSIIENDNGITIMHIRNTNKEIGIFETKSGAYYIDIEIPSLWLNPGIYSFYFKIIFSGYYGNMRHISDKYPLDINGNSSNINAILNPQVKWSTSLDNLQ